MRIADSQLYSHARANGGAARVKVLNASDALSTGYRVRGPGDDVTAYGLTQRHNALAQQSTHFERVTGRAQDEVNAADAALGRVTEQLIEVRTLGLQLANDTYNASDRAGAAQTIAGIRASITGALNQEHGGRFMFAGSQTDTPPFDVDGNYNGDDQVRRIEISPGFFENVSISPETAILGVGGGVNIYTALQDLEAALLTDDSAQIRATFDALSTSLEQISEARTELGSHATVLAAAQTTHQTVIEQSTIAASNASEQDLIEGASNLAQAQSALDATLTAAAKTFELSLLDRLR